MPQALTELFNRDLTKVLTELRAYPDEKSVWQTLPGVTNPAGTLALHLTGNLMQYIGADLGGAEYQRDRDAEFARRDVLRTELVAGLEQVREVVAHTLRDLPDARLQEIPAHLPPTFAPDTTVQTFLLHLYGHLNWHLGQMNYLRRVLEGEN